MNDGVEMTTNQLQQNISINLADDYLSTLLAGNVMKFLVDLTKIFNSVFTTIYCSCIKCRLCCYQHNVIYSRNRCIIAEKLELTEKNKLRF